MQAASAAVACGVSKPFVSRTVAISPAVPATVPALSSLSLPSLPSLRRLPLTPGTRQLGAVSRDRTDAAGGEPCGGVQGMSRLCIGPPRENPAGTGPVAVIVGFTSEAAQQAAGPEPESRRTLHRLRLKDSDDSSSTNP